MAEVCITVTPRFNGIGLKYKEKMTLQHGRLCVICNKPYDAGSIQCAYEEIVIISWSAETKLGHVQMCCNQCHQQIGGITQAGTAVLGTSLGERYKKYADEFLGRNCKECGGEGIRNICEHKFVPRGRSLCAW